MLKVLKIIAVWSAWINLSILADDILCILPDYPSNVSCPCQPCATLSQYLAAYNGTLPVVSNVKYNLIPGEHLVPSNMKLHDLHNFTFIGLADTHTLPVELISCSGSYLEITESEHLIIRNIVFRQCKASPRDQQYSGFEANLVLHLCWSCTVDNVTFFQYGLMGHNVYGWPFLSNVVIKLIESNSSLYLNYHGLLLTYSTLSGKNQSRIACILNEVFVSGHNNKYLSTNDIPNIKWAAFIKINQTNYHFTIEIKNCLFKDINQGVMSISSFSTASDTTVLLQNCHFFKNNEPGTANVPMIEIQLISISTMLSFSNCTFQHIARWRCTIFINLSLFNPHLVPFHLIPPIYKSQRKAAKVLINGCTFFNTRNPLLHVTGHLTKFDHDIIHLGPLEVQVMVSNEEFKDYAIYLHYLTVIMKGPLTIMRSQALSRFIIFETCVVVFTGRITLTSNVCAYLIALKSDSLFIALTQNTSITLSNNCVSNEIIEVDNNPYNNPFPYCIFQFVTIENISSEDTPMPNDYRIILDNIDSCFVNDKDKKCKISFHDYTSHCQWINESAFHKHDPAIINEQILQHNSDQISEHKIICIPLNKVTNCSLDVLGHIYPGQTLQVELSVPCSGNKATLHVETHHTRLPSSSCKIVNQNQLINFLTSNTSMLNFTIASNATKFCELFLTVSPYLYQQYEAFYAKLWPCPTGFALKNGVCDCDPVLSTSTFIYIKSCNIDQLTINRPENSFIALLSYSNSTYSVCTRCPMDYCLPHSSDLNLQNPDLQCQFNRTGILCSQCQQSLSMVFGSSRCIHCTNTNILISVVILFAGIALVIILYLLNLTVTNGSIIGIIFYVNVISINDSTFLANNNIFKALRVFMSFVNLDLGIETCFYNGMNSYAKVLLQLFFPTYLLLISTFIIIASRYSSRILHWTSARSLPVLATLFLLSYTSVVRTVLTVLFSYSAVTELPSGQRQIVWSIDASVPLFGIQFAILFIICLLLFLFLVPFNITLLFVRFLSRFKIVNRFKPFLDAFQGSYKDKYHYWLGIQITLRSLFFVFYNLPTQIKLFASTVILLCYTISFGYTHPNKNRLVNMQELALLLNLTVVYAVSYQNNNKIFSLFANIMVAISLLQFCLIIFSHLLTYALHCDLIKILKAVATRMIPSKKPDSFIAHNVPLDIPERSFNYAEYRDGLISDDFELKEFVLKNDEH